MRPGLVFALLVGFTTLASAQDGPVVEEPDPTRLDVERLPPEAIEITRDLYSHGFFLEAYIGTRTFVGGVGDLSNTGPFAHIGFGYELTRWLWIGGAVEGSMHRTDAPSPPSPTVFEVLNFLAEVRFQLNMTARAALWLGGEFGIGFATGEVLRAYGLQDADNVGLVYGGQLGLDWHMRNRHHSIGIVGGARVFPNLEGIDGSVAIGVHASLYLRYVF
ncbi:MAG: hypothetical protein AAGE52_34840 [Myxococcota bacterium]